jgi:hypothetical protein
MSSLDILSQSTLQDKNLLLSSKSSRRDQKTKAFSTKENTRYAQISPLTPLMAQSLEGKVFAGNLLN